MADTGGFHPHGWLEATDFRRSTAWMEMCRFHPEESSFGDRTSYYKKTTGIFFVLFLGITIDVKPGMKSQENLGLIFYYNNNWDEKTEIFRSLILGNQTKYPSHSIHILGAQKRSSQDSSIQSPSAQAG